MNKSLIALGVGAAMLVGAGVWIGRSTQETEASPSSTTAQPRDGRIAIAPTRASQPALPSRAVTKPATPGLDVDLRDADPRVRATAVREAARDGADPQIFLAASRDRDLNVGVAATEALGALHARGELPAQELITRATDKSLDPRVRVTALNGLGLVASPDAARTLAELARRGDLVERRSAAILLVHQDADLAVPALIDALGDADEVVRANALEALRGKARGRDFGADAAAWRAWWQSRSR